MEVTRLDYNAQAGYETPEQPIVPFYARNVWDWWWELNTRRPPGFENLAPMSYTEIMSWILLTGKQLAPEDIRWLIEMDNVWLTTIAKERNAKRDRDKEESDRNKGK